MQLNVEASKVDTNTAGNFHKFTLKNNPKLFRILSDGLYSNKIRSIIRELSCNAYDSHIQAGKQDVPFEVELPSIFNPVFRIKDFGIGLSNNDIYNIFSCYGESTKNDSNELVGAFGLGSKSPFSYTLSYNITSCFNGKVYQYVAFISEDGIPCLTKLNEYKSKEPNGLEISFAVDPADFGNFEREISDVLQNFKMPIDIIRGETKKRFIPKISCVIFSDKEFSIINRNNREDDKSYAIMGNVAYPIDEQQIERYIEKDKKYILYEKCHIYFDIGEIEISVSREQIAYTPLTIKKIVEKYNKISKKFLDYLEYLKSFDSWNSYIELSSIIENLRDSYELRDRFELNDPFHIKNKTNEFQNLKFYYYRGNGTLTNLDSLTTSANRSRFGESKLRNIKITNEGFKITPVTSMKFIVFDKLEIEKDGKKQKITLNTLREIGKNEKYRCIFIIPQLNFSKEKVDAEIKKFFETLKNPDKSQIKYLEDVIEQIKTKEKVSYEYVSRPKYMIYAIDKKNQHLINLNVNDIEIPKKRGQIAYVKRIGKDLVDKNEKVIPITYYSDFFLFCKDLEKIYCINKINWKKFTTSENFSKYVPLDDYLKECAKKHFNDENFRFTFYCSEFFCNENRLNVWESFYEQKNGILDKNIVKILETVSEKNNYNYLVGRLSNFSRFLELKKDNGKDIIKLLSQVCEKYPLFTYFFSRSYYYANKTDLKKHIDGIVDYFNMIHLGGKNV